MRYGNTLLIASLATLAVTLGLAWLPGAWIEHRESGSEITVFENTPIGHLSGSNVVDVLESVPLHERIGHVEWRNSVLSVTLHVAAESGRPAHWFHDAEKLIHLSFLQLDNVNRLLVRIEEKATYGKRLLAAMDVRRSDEWLNRVDGKTPFGDPVHDEDWRQRLRFSFTRAWEERFGPVAGYSAKSP